MALEQCCGNCRFWALDEMTVWDILHAKLVLNSVYGQCRRYAPTQHGWPDKVYMENWCGEFEPIGRNLTRTPPKEQPQRQKLLVPKTECTRCYSEGCSECAGKGFI